MEIISSSDAWLVADDTTDDAIVAERDIRPTNSARRVKALVEQITGRRVFPQYPHLDQCPLRSLLSSSKVLPPNTIPQIRPTTNTRGLPRPYLIILGCLRNVVFVSVTGCTWRSRKRWRELREYGQSRRPTASHKRHRRGTTSLQGPHQCSIH